METRNQPTREQRLEHVRKLAQDGIGTPEIFPDGSCPTCGVPPHGPDRAGVTIFGGGGPMWNAARRAQSLGVPWHPGEDIGV